MSLNLPALTVIATQGQGGWVPTPQMQGWWRSKMRSAAHPRALQPIAIATGDGRPTRYLMGLWRSVYGQAPFSADLVIIQDGKATPEFLLIAND